ncbi:DUF5956 family protein [Nakamurella lactea]|uniref:DUF5956 family protein n=1 Tax=Nakamurella lactea TaxID=459515 RepID=UPI003898E2D4
MFDPWDAEPARVAVHPEFGPLLLAIERILRGSSINPPQVWELSEAIDLEDSGWVCLGDVPLLHTLPAVWPGDDRVWVMDAVPKVTVSMVGGSPSDGSVARTTIRSSEAQNDVDEFLDSLSLEAGLPSAPRGRVWFVRSPWNSVSTSGVLDEIGNRMVALASAGQLTDSLAHFIAAQEVIGRYASGT